MTRRTWTVPRPGQRGTSARCRGGKAQPGDLVGDALVGQAGREHVRAAIHLVGGAGLRGLGAHLVGLAPQRLDLAFGVGPLTVAAALVGLALLQVGLPADVVDVEGGAVRVEVPDLVDDRVEQVRRRG